jgi:hypothetical protein
MALPQVATRHVEAIAPLLLAKQRLGEELCSDPASNPFAALCNRNLNAIHHAAAMLHRVIDLRVFA